MDVEIAEEIAAGGHDSGRGLHHVLRDAFCGQATWPPRCAITVNNTWVGTTTVNTTLPENVGVIEVIDSCGSLAPIA